MDENNIFMKLHNLEDPGSLQDIQLDNTQSQIISQTLSQDIKLHESPVQWGYVIDTDSKLDIKLQNYESKPATITVIKIGGIEDLNPLNFTNHMPTTMNPMHHQVVIQDKMLVDQIHQQAAMGVTKMKEKPKKKYTPQTLTNTPAVICQNCDGSFSTKYQFQRHQCEFNASKVILKSEIPKRQIEKPKTKHECDVCHKSFMTDHNLDRHRLSHGDKKPFTCQNCGKGFVLESRLNTHIETHCKLSTAEPKRFYKTDLSVWQCWNCQLITATEPNHLIHICDLTNPTFISPKVIIPLQQNPTMNDEHNKIVNTNNTFIFTTKQDENGIATTLYENTRMDVYHANNLTTTTSDTTTSMLSTQNNFDENFEKAINDGIAVDTVSTTSSYESTDQQLDSTQDSNNITSTTMLLQEKQEQAHTFKIISVEQLFQCEYCNRTYANKDVLKEHQNSHGTDKNYQCMFCDDSFDSYTNALIHWQHKCDEKTNLFCLPKIIICKFCDKGFKSHELLYAHKYKLKHFVPKVFKDDNSMQIESVTLSSQHVDYQQQNGDEFTTLFDNSQHDDCSNSHDDVKPNFNITYTVDNGTNHHHLYTEMHDRNNDLVNFDMNNNGGYVDTITITEFTKKDSEQHLQLTVDDTNNILQLNDVVDNYNTITKQLQQDNVDHIDNIHENISPLHDNCPNDLTQIDEFLNDIANKVLNKSDIKKIDNDIDNDNNNNSNNNNTITNDNVDNLSNIITKENNIDDDKVLSETMPLNDNNDFDNDDNSMRRKLRSSTRKSNDLIKNDKKSLSDNKKCAKILSTTLIQNENLNNRVSTRNMERMKNKEFNDDDNAKIKIENIEEFNGEDKENNDEDKENTLKRKCDEELFLQGEQGVIIDNMQNNNDYVKNLPVVPVKRGRKPKPKLPPNEIVLLCSEEYRFQCEKCAKVTRSIDDLIEHRQSDHGSNFDCKDCGQVVHSAKALMIHCRAHQSLKPFVCDQCGRSYSQTSHLWQHMRFHQGIKPFACPHEGCEARYTIRPDLKDHIRKVHTRERPFRCAVCGKCFLTGSVYYQHRLIHNNDRRYGCDMCGKRFFRADALNNHRRIHTDERPFPCPVCGREFRQKGDRNKHHRTQHPTEISLSNTISLHNQTI